MAEIRIRIPDDKIPLVIEAVTYYVNQNSDEPITVSPAEASQWVKEKLIQELKRLVCNFQEQNYRKSFEFIDPLEE